jgi:hypothetical protein
VLIEIEGVPLVPVFSVCAHDPGAVRAAGHPDYPRGRKRGMADCRGIEADASPGYDVKRGFGARMRARLRDSDYNSKGDYP